jgi:hypothetical protein
MSYSAGESAILTRIRAHADYDASNTAANAWNLLDSGADDNYVILKPSTEPAPVAFISPLTYVVSWTTVAECWRQYLDDGTTSTALFGDVNKIIGQIQADKSLSLSYVQVSRIISVSAPAFRWAKDGGPAWLVQELAIQWLEEVQLTYI